MLDGIDWRNPQHTWRPQTAGRAAKRVHKPTGVWLNPGVTPGADVLPDNIDALRAALLAERTARHEAEARATGAEALIANLKLLIAKLQRDRFGPTSERSRRLLDQLELQLEELQADAAEAEAKSPEPGNSGT